MHEIGGKLPCFTTAGHLALFTWECVEEEKGSSKIFVAMGGVGCRCWRAVVLVRTLVACDVQTLILLLPQLAAVNVESVVIEDGVLVITAMTRDGPAACTGCEQVARRVHSTYVRHVADEAVGGRPVRIDLQVRRLYCENPACPKTTFAEQVAGLTRRYQQRTPALQTVVDAVALALAVRPARGCCSCSTRRSRG